MRFSKLSIFLVIVVTLASCASAKKAKIRNQRINTVINTAKGYIGTPYRWGGTSRSGIDCSGLLSNSYRMISYELPRTSRQQSEVGKKVKKKKLQKGDLVFFATSKKRRKITHVGLVTEVNKGNVKFIHSSSSLGVVISDMNQKYYRKRFRTGRRPF